MPAATYRADCFAKILDDAGLTIDELRELF
jgi:hypothetical protein